MTGCDNRIANLSKLTDVNRQSVWLSVSFSRLQKLATVRQHRTRAHWRKLAHRDRGALPLQFTEKLVCEDLPPVGIELAKAFNQLMP